MIYWISFFFCWIYVKLFYPTKVIGRKNLPKKEGYVLTCNHYSNLDVVILDVALGKKIRYLGKKELFKNKFVGWYIKKLGGYPVDRDNPDIGAFKFGVNALKNNKILGIFPEGTRNKGADDADLQDLKSGAITFASKTGTKIVPMMIYRRARFWRRNYIVIGKPIEVVAENPKRLTHEETEENAKRLKETMTNLRANFEAERLAKKNRKKKNKKVETIENEK